MWMVGPAYMALGFSHYKGLKDPHWYHQTMAMMLIVVTIAHRIQSYAIYGNIHHQYTPVMLASIYH